jgi:hypothetical protein
MADRARFAVAMLVAFGALGAMAVAEHLLPAGVKTPVVRALDRTLSKALVG